MKTVDWYFDFISPFAYLQSSRLDDFAEYALVRCKPVLLAGLLKHHGSKGPAEIAAKRGWTYEHALWLARRNDLPMRLPSAHPFNPLALLRLSVRLGNSVRVVQRLFAYVWRDGHLPGEEGAWDALLEELGVRPAELDAPEIKQSLRETTQQAIEAGVFGVPTAVIDGHVIWGFDATDMVHAKIADDPFFESAGLAAAHSLPVGVQRET